jgi:hypothetical protein
MYMSPHRSRERILNYGFAGSGKSQGIIDIARNSNTRLWIVDTDRAWDRMLDGAPDIEGQVASLADVRMEAQVKELSQWEVMCDAVTHAARNMGREDWLVVDMMSVAWPWCQAHFAMEAYGKAIDDFMLEARKTAIRMEAETDKRSSKSAFEGMSDWPTINRIFDTQLIDPILLARGHVYMTAEQDDVRTNAGELSTSDEVMSQFGRIGKIPRGQKGVPYTAHTVLHMGATMAGAWVYTTAKDRIGREKKTMAPLAEEFMKGYLVKVAGWRNEAAVRAAAGAATTRTETDDVGGPERTVAVQTPGQVQPAT